ncbi:MAG: TetR/AcrR family transcriptional regulator [Promethearchaeota archaeon]
MKNNDTESTKQKIISATLDLLRETGDLNEISIRKIVKKAGIKGVGLINYHFGTRDNLINEAVRTDTNALIDQWDEIYEKMEQEPSEKLRIMLRGTGDLTDVNPMFGKISILYDILNPAGDDNTSRTIEKYMMIIKEIFPDKDDQDIKIITHTLISAVQLAFLRADVMKKFTGLDIFEKEQRDTIIEIIITTIIKNKSE